MDNVYKIIKPSSIIIDNLKDKNIISEAIFGECVKTLVRDRDWILIELINDHYKGWIKAKDIGDMPNSNYKVTSLRTFIKEKPNIKAKDIDYLSFQSEIFVDLVNNEWVKIKLSNCYHQNYGYIYKKDICKKLSYTKNWVNTAEKFINIPYRWGGKDTKGIDCSALLQLTLKSIGLFIPRDTNEQINFSCFETINQNQLKRGSIIFWDGHVGIMLDKYKLLHANGFHMKIVAEPLTEVCNRMDNNKILSCKNLVKI